MKKALLLVLANACICCRALDAQDGFCNDWLQRSDQAKADQPHWMTPLATVTPDRKSTRLNSSHLVISYAVFCLKKKNSPNIYRREATTNSISSARHSTSWHALRQSEQVYDSGQAEFTSTLQLTYFFREGHAPHNRSLALPIAIRI